MRGGGSGGVFRSIFTQNDSLGAAVVAGRQGAKPFLPRRVLRGRKRRDQERYARLPVSASPESRLWALFVIGIMQNISCDDEFFPEFQSLAQREELLNAGVKLDPITGPRNLLLRNVTQ